MSNILIFLIYLRSFYHITQRKLHYFEKITFSCRVLKTMVGAIGTTCTVTYYDCVENVCFLIFVCSGLSFKCVWHKFLFEAKLFT